jgi:hypothetical protein
MRTCGQSTRSGYGLPAKYPSRPRLFLGVSLIAGQGSVALASYRNGGTTREILANAKTPATVGALDEGNAAGVARGASPVVGIAWIPCDSCAILVSRALGRAKGASVDGASAGLDGRFEAQAGRAFGCRRVVGGRGWGAGSTDIAWRAKVTRCNVCRVPNPSSARKPKAIFHALRQVGGWIAGASLDSEVVDDCKVVCRAEAGVRA